MILSAEALSETGFASVGRNVRIDEGARIFGAEHIHIGDNTRIDSFVVLSAGPGQLHVGRNVHLAAGVQVFASGGVTVGDFCGLSGRVSVYSVSDDYSDGFLTNPTVPEEYRKVTSAPVILERHALIGAGSVILPGVTIGEGAAVGALSLVNKSLPPFVIASGNPVRRVGERDAERLHELERKFLENSDQ